MSSSLSGSKVALIPVSCRIFSSSLKSAFIPSSSDFKVSMICLNFYDANFVRDSPFALSASAAVLSASGVPSFFSSAAFSSSVDAFLASSAASSAFSASFTSSSRT